MIRWLFAVAAIAFVKPQPVEAQVLSGENTYYEVCLIGSNECVVGSFSKYGSFTVLIRAGKSLPGMIIADVIKPGPTGDGVAVIRDALYQDLLAKGLVRVYIDPNNFQSELNEVQKELDYNLFKCVSGVVIACGGGGLAALGTGGWALALAGYACFQAYTNCEDLDKANKDLFARRKELEERAKEEAAKENAGNNSGGGGGGGGGRPATGGQGGWFGPGASAGGSGGSVSASETPPGGGPPRGIILN